MMLEMPVTMQDVARATGVSSNVSNVVNGFPYIRETTDREREHPAVVVRPGFRAVLKSRMEHDAQKN